MHGAAIITHSSVLIKNCLQFLDVTLFAGFRNIRGFHNFLADQNYRELLPSPSPTSQGPGCPSDELGTSGQR